MTVDSTKNTLYISQRAANAIIADVAPYRISSEALSAINNFLDEFLYFLIDSARSLDLIRIKDAISQVLPTSLGKNAIVEAELELKTYVESGNSDHTKEKTMEINPFPLQKVFEQFRVKCQFFSTLGERGADDRDPDSVPDLYASEGIHIAPSLAIYLTAVLEYVGEYILILVAKASEKQGVEVARSQEVYSALSEDSQIFPLFRRTNLKEQMESQRESTTSRYIQSSTPRSPTKSSSYNGGIRQTSLDNSWPTSPVKSLSDYSRHSSEHKNVGMRSTKSMQSLQRQGDKEPDLRNVSSMEDNREKMKSFETLISSNQTMKVSLTPNRLITIETHKRPPKLAPREPVSRERIIQKSNPTSPKFEDFDDDDDELFGKRKSKKDKEESLWEFLKNTSPDDVLGEKTRKKRSKTPSSPGNNPRYTPLMPSSPSSPYQSDRINATINQTLSSSQASNNQYQNRTNFSSLHHSKSLDHTQSSYYQHSQASKSTGNIQNSATKSLPPVPKPRPDPLDLIDDDDDLLYPQGQKKPKRRHEAQDLIDFLSTSPPKDPILNNGVGSLDAGNVGKKKEKKLKKLLSKLKKSSFADESTNLSSQRLTNASINSLSTTNTYGSNSTSSTLVNKPARYIKIEIPKIPPKEDNREQSIFDQVEIQGRHARQISRASLTGSTRSLQYTPNRSTFSSTGGMKSPTILERSNSEQDADNYDEYVGITDRSRKSQKSTNISNIQQSPPTNTSTLSQSNANDVPTYPAHKVPSPVSPSRQKSYNTNNNNFTNKNNNQTSSQGINRITPALPKEQKMDVSENLLPPISAAKSSATNKRKSQQISAKALQNFTSSEELLLTNSNNIKENENIEVVQTKPEKIVISKESIHNKAVVQTKSKGVVLSKELVQNKEVAQKELMVSNEYIQNEIVQIKSKEAIESVQNNEIISDVGFLVSIIEAEIKNVQEEIKIITHNEEEELEEAFIVEWLLGTNLTFKNAMSYVDIMQEYEDDEIPEMEKSEYEDANDIEFIDDYDDDSNIVQIKT
ncbi:hypothetical protein RhiirA4_357600 [Rhizophagus irregularis]|uniref:Uncharacterized protein n=1 Tax=Rhizophagus irregularis TaxID=588596 RepID=A0A2I1GGR8_9GLOM|nr:hypothetical protein RhiirA4_357600 [Rhizophagus irregularis]